MALASGALCLGSGKGDWEDVLSPVALASVNFTLTVIIVQSGNNCIDNNTVSLVSWCTLYNLRTIYNNALYFVCDVKVNFRLHIGHNYHGHYLHAGGLSVNNYVRKNKVREANVRE